MDSETLSRLAEKDRQNFEQSYQSASKSGKEILDMLLSSLIANHDIQYQLDEKEPPSIINNYKLDTSPYSSEVDKEFERILSKMPSETHSELKQHYKNSSPQEKVLVKQALGLRVEMHKFEIRGLIRELLSEAEPEEIIDIPSILALKRLSIKLSKEELNELIELEKGRNN